jgi:hypothetical protein
MRGYAPPQIVDNNRVFHDTGYSPKQFSRKACDDLSRHNDGRLEKCNA